MYIPIRKQRLKCLCGCEEWFDADVKTRPPLYKNHAHKMRAARKRGREKQIDPVKALEARPDPPRCSACNAPLLYAGSPCFSPKCFYDRLKIQPPPLLLAAITSRY